LNYSLHLFFSNKASIGKVLLILVGIFMFLFALDLMAESFEHLGSKTIGSFINEVSNPFIGLFIGLLVTALIQSSSTTTTMAVAAVATGSITLHNAIPIIMGANIGTTITSTIVALGYIAKRDQFNKAVSAAALHNFFNIIVVLLLFPLEYKYGIITSSSEYLASKITNPDVLTSVTNVQFKLFDLSIITKLFTKLAFNPIINLLISFVLLFSSIKLISKIIYEFVIGKTESKMRKYIFKITSKSFLWGTLSTAIIQSSSITTSLVVPLVATGKTTLNKVMPFILGANIGTTITAFIAVIFKSQTAINIAIAHLLINVFGVIFFLSSPVLRQILEWLASQFGQLASKYRFTIFIYILLVFFILPFLLIYLTQ
jgi:solute carrier family 34 (sodium-dependent phosphate cotransporter)